MTGGTRTKTLFAPAVNVVLPAALRGHVVGWGKLERKATVEITAAAVGPSAGGSEGTKLA